MDLQEKDEPTTSKYSLRERQIVDYNEGRKSKGSWMEADAFEDVNTSSYEKSFKEKYNKMNDDLKWKLQCTGRVVEDVLFNSISNFTSEHLVHSFTIDINDSMLKETSVGEIRDLIKDTDFGGSSFEIETLTYSIHSLIWQYERNPNASLSHDVCGVNVWDP
ncbi:unnamed protein product [Rhizophagus irregularis]|nr:unnamed protein product [Rhizophagus irregularis]